jgi:APA family basic amino acid/polyamine antiporter
LLDRLSHFYKYLGKSWKLIQTTFTVTKLLSFFGLIIFGLIMMKGDVWDATGKMPEKKSFCLMVQLIPIDRNAILGAIAAAMVGSIFSSDAWNNVTFYCSEIKNPKRNIGLALSSAH